MSRATADLQTREVGRIQGQFFVPSYQRGYRWGPQEVSRLLEDIDGSTGDYYLQPIVVKQLAEDRWELIDGQQRLTTLYLIRKYIQAEVLRSAEMPYSLEYETRAESQSYLDDLDFERRRENIDFFHIAEAYRTIQEWFAGHGLDAAQKAIDFFTALSKRVFVIWYEAPTDVDAIALFTRLNVGRIPLTDAELVKAKLLSANGADQRHVMAAQWDAIERDLRRPELWAFISGRAHNDQTNLGLLLDTLAGGRTGRDRPMYFTFETIRRRVDETSAQVVWDEVLDLHDRVTGWFEDRSLFHKVGFLVSTGWTLEKLAELAQAKTRSAFDTALDTAIRDQLKLSAEALRDLSYRSSKGKVEQVLTLWNVETVRRATGSSERYSFQSHAAGVWSLEHIHAQASEGLSRVDQWTEWLRLHLVALAEFPHVDDSVRSELAQRVDAALDKLNGDTFQSLQREIVEYFSAAEDGNPLDVDSIANLALLASGDNSALSNGVFEVKRREIIARDRSGSYIPVCTRNAFLKYYTTAASLQPHFWGPDDRAAYLDAMVDSLTPYLLADVDAVVESEEENL